MPLIVIIRDLDSGSSTRFEATESPVRVGRNALNDLVLEAGFVSQFHGVLRFGGDGIHYKDLGSTNGSTLDGKRLVRNVEASVTGQSDLRIGPLRLDVDLKSDTASSPGRPSQSGTRHVRTLYGIVRAPVPGMVTEGASEPVASTTPTGPLAGPARTDSAALGIAREFAARLLPRGQEPGDEPEARKLLEAVAVILDAFAHSLVGLRRGVEQTGAELGVRSVPSRSPLTTAKDPQQVLAHLLDKGVEPQKSAEELVAVFADFGVHQVALLNGITESVRALLIKLSGGDGGERGRGKLLWPFRGEGAKLEATIRELLDDDRQLHAAIFGEEFGLAYAAGTLGGHQKDEP